MSQSPNCERRNAQRGRKQRKGEQEIAEATENQSSLQPRIKRVTRIFPADRYSFLHSFDSSDSWLPVPRVGACHSAERLAGAVFWKLWRNDFQMAASRNCRRSSDRR